MIKKIIVTCLFFNLPLSMEAAHDAQATPSRFLEALTAGAIVAGIAHKEIGSAQETGFKTLNKIGRVPVIAAGVFGFQLFVVDSTRFFTDNKKIQTAAALGAIATGISSSYHYEMPVWVQLGFATYAVARTARVCLDERAKK